MASKGLSVFSWPLQAGPWCLPSISWRVFKLLPFVLRVSCEGIQDAHDGSKTALHVGRGRPCALQHVGFCLWPMLKQCVPPPCAETEYLCVSRHYLRHLMV